MPYTGNDSDQEDDMLFPDHRLATALMEQRRRRADRTRATESTALRRPPLLERLGGPLTTLSAMWGRTNRVPGI